MPGRECSARSTVPMETPTVSAISLIPADFASADSALERMDLRVWPPGSLRLSFEDFTGAIMRMYSQIVSDLEKASVPVKELHGPGVVAVTLAAGRVVALAFSKDGPNLLWTHPDLGDTGLVKANPARLVG